MLLPHIVLPLPHGLPLFLWFMSLKRLHDIHETSSRPFLVNQGHLLQIPWRELHCGTGATWLPPCRFSDHLKPRFNKHLFSLRYLLFLLKKTPRNKGVLVYNHHSYLLPTSWDDWWFIQVMRFMDVGVGLGISVILYSEEFLETTFQLRRKKTRLGCCVCTPVGTRGVLGRRKDERLPPRSFALSISNMNSCYAVDFSTFWTDFKADFFKNRGTFPI